MIRPETQNANHRSRQQKETEESVLKQVDDLIRWLDSPEDQPPALRATLASLHETERFRAMLSQPMIQPARLPVPKEVSVEQFLIDEASSK